VPRADLGRLPALDASIIRDLSISIADMHTRMTVLLTVKPIPSLKNPYPISRINGSLTIESE
jgi:hypothetical protein